MNKRTLTAGLAALGLAAGAGLGTAQTAQADSIVHKSCSVLARDANNVPDGYLMEVNVDFSWGAFGVKAINIHISNITGQNGLGTPRQITLSQDRWQTYNASQVDYGVGGTINPGTYTEWDGVTYYSGGSGSTQPQVYVGAYFTTRPSVGNWLHLRPDGTCWADRVS
jgi:hypothetical protein